MSSLRSRCVRAKRTATLTVLYETRRRTQSVCRSGLTCNKIFTPPNGTHVGHRCTSIGCYHNHGFQIQTTCLGRPGTILDNRSDKKRKKLGQRSAGCDSWITCGNMFHDAIHIGPDAPPNARLRRQKVGKAPPMRALSSQVAPHVAYLYNCSSMEEFWELVRRYPSLPLIPEWDVVRGKKKISHNMRPPTLHAWIKGFRITLEGIGIPKARCMLITCYSNRHTAIAILCYMGVDVVVILSCTGWTDLKMLRTYFNP